MDKLIRVVVVVVALAGNALASSNVFVEIQGFPALNPYARTFTICQDEEARLTVRSRNGSVANDLSGTFATFNFTDTRDDWADRYVFDVEVFDATGGIARAAIPAGALPVGSYQAKMKLFQQVNSNYLGDLAFDAWSVTNCCDDCGGSAAPSVVAITDTTAVGAPDGYVPAVSNGAIVLGPPPAGSGGSGGIQSLNGNTNAVQYIVGNAPIVVTNIAGTTYIGWQEYGGSFFINPGTNYARMYFSGSVTQQVLFAGTGTVALTGWAGAGFGTTYGGSAGLTQTILHFTNGMYLDCLIPDGGQGLTGTPARTDSAFPNGGRGAGRQTASGGGGALIVLMGGTTDIVMVAGGGAGGLPNNAVYGGFGGGDTGGDGAGSRRGYGGTQTNGGALASQTGVMLYTNTAGSYLAGGDAGITTNALGAVVIAATGGGDGYQGGSGGFATASETSGGGAGSGYWNPSICVWGSTVRGGYANPPGTEIPGYVAGAGVPGGTLNSTRAGTGLLLVTVVTQ